MKSILNLHKHPAGMPLLADDVVEFHAACLLLLLKFCGQRGYIDGLTKLAKLDFFVRYPHFFDKMSAYLGNEAQSQVHYVESSMVRHHYGPWDKRYYHILAYLESKKLITISKTEPKTFRFALTPHGEQVAKQIADGPAFAHLCQHMRQVKKTLGSRKGEGLKRLIYKVFDEEVAQKPLGEVIL